MWNILHLPDERERCESGGRGRENVENRDMWYEDFKRKRRLEEQECKVELSEKRNDVKRDIIGFRVSLKGLCRDAVQLSLGKGVV